MLGCDWLQAPILASFTHVCTTPLRGRWSDGQLALLFSIAFLFAARGMFGSQSIDASNVTKPHAIWRAPCRYCPGQATSTCLARYHPASPHDMPRCSSFAVSWCVVLRMQLSSITALTVIID